MKALRVLLILMVTGCGYRKAEEIAISPDFSNETQGVIVEAAEMLFSAVPEMRVPILISKDRGKGAVQPLPTNSMCAKDAIANNKLTLTRAPVIAPCPGFDFSQDEWVIIFAHELGHALTGTDDHIDEDGHVMSEFFHASISISKPTNTDVEFLRERLR